MQIPKNEIGRPLVEAIYLAHGTRPHLSTAIRWCQSRNRYGNRLESWMQGGRRVTSVEAVRRYDEANTLAADRLSVPGSTSRQRSATHEKAKRELEAELA